MIILASAGVWLVLMAAIGLVVITESMNRLQEMWYVLFVQIRLF